MLIKLPKLKKEEEERACRNAKGETAFDLVPFSLQPAGAPPNHLDRLSAAVSGTKIPEPSPTEANTRSPASQAHTSMEQEIQPAAQPVNRHRPQPRRKAQGEQVAPAALLSQSRSADEIAAVFCNFTEDHQRHRIKMWACLSEDELKSVEGLTIESRQKIKQVCSSATSICAADCYISIHRAPFSSGAAVY